MALTRYDMLDLMPEEHRMERRQRLDDCMKNDIWASKVFKDVAILILSYPGQRAYLLSCVETHSKLGYFMALTWDRGELPDQDIMDKIDLFLMPHSQTWGDTDYPYFWGLKWGVPALQSFKYIYCIDGDFILERPDNFDKILAMMGDSDIMSCGPDWDGWSSAGAFIMKSDCFLKTVQFIQDNYIPFDNYERTINTLRNVEERIGGAVKHFGFKQKTVDNPLVWDEVGAKQGTWGELVGLRHIHGELDFAFKKRLIPPHYKWIDGKYLLPIYQYDLIKKYWDTKDESNLEEWWAKE